MAEIKHEFQSTPTNMVQAVRNIVEGYKMGPMRALAQDPVQNSYDARMPGSPGPVEVEYRLHCRKGKAGGETCMLTVTDRNTTGLRGPVLSIRDLDVRAHTTGYLQLDPDENWAAWEAMGYTKVGEDFLGSRGQGKAAFLYHSRHDTGLKGIDQAPLERMIILYDTLLEDGTYRLGVRLAQPADLVTHPPFEDNEAKKIIQSEYREWSGSPIPLHLDPLREVGTRVIVPFLASDVVNLIRNGELLRWLQRCWWRAIQLGELRVALITDSGARREVEVPAWWRDEPWRQQPLPGNAWLRENIPLEQGSPLRIKRIVLLHGPSLKFDEIEGFPQQYSGVQLLRRRQWIETLGVSEKFGDYVPREKRPGFRGFVEFEDRLERDLRTAESPQHDAFIRHKMIVRQIDALVGDAVREFAASQGWLSPGAIETNQDRSAAEMLDRIVGLFQVELPPGKGTRPDPAKWTASLDLKYPRAESTRIEWGEKLSNIEAACSREPPGPRQDVTMRLDIIAPDGTKTHVGTRGRRTRDGSAVAEFGETGVVKVSRGKRDIECPNVGRHRLRVVVIAGGESLASASRCFYVRADPPARVTRSIGVDIGVRNITTGSALVRSGDEIDIAVTVSNRSSSDSDVFVDASFEQLLLSNSEHLALRGRPEGDTPSSKMLLFRRVGVFTSPPPQDYSGLHILVEPGVHYVKADVKDERGTVIASASKAVTVEVDPHHKSAVPFDIGAREDPSTPSPVWELEPPHGLERGWTLLYAKHHPTFKAALEADKSRTARTPLYGTKHFWAETICSALLEWAATQFRDNGDEAGFKLLTARGKSADDTLWERYYSKLDDLQVSLNDPLSYAQLGREVAGLMLYILGRESA